MSNPTIVIHNAATGETVEREMTAEEIAALEQDRADAPTLEPTNE